MFRSNEQTNFAKLIGAHLKNPDAPLLLEGGTGLGKTRAYLAPLFESGKRIAIVLPTHQLMDQLLASSDLEATRENATVEAFRPVSWFDSRKEYNEYKASVMDAQVMLCTSASIIIDQRLGGEYNGASKRDYTLFDEADQLPDAAALQLDCEIKKVDLDDMGIKVTTGEETARKVLEKDKHVTPEIKASAKLIIECYENPAWYHTAGTTDEGGIALYHRLPGRLLKRIANTSNVAFVSATLSLDKKFDNFKTAMGISNVSRLSNVIEPESHGKLNFTFRPFQVKVNEVINPEWIEAVKAEIETCKKPALVITSSFELSETLAGPHCTVRGREETSSQACQRMGNNEVLVATNAWAGLDTPIQWATVIIPKVPFDKPTELDGVVESTYLHSRSVALRRMKQGIGRGLRTPDSECNIVVMDARAEKLKRFTPDRFLAEWQTAIENGVKSFDSWREGKQKIHESTAYERDPQVRKAALGHYGKECQAGCGFPVRHESQLDVHHVEELSENRERQTTLEDLNVLCANCHRLIHTTKPAMSLDALRCLIHEEDELASP